jgi:hypothetical protein
VNFCKPIEAPVNSFILDGRHITVGEVGTVDFEFLMGYSNRGHFLSTQYTITILYEDGFMFTGACYVGVSSRSWTTNGVPRELQLELIHEESGSHVLLEI